MVRPEGMVARRTCAPSRRPRNSPRGPSVDPNNSTIETDSITKRACYCFELGFKYMVGVTTFKNSNMQRDVCLCND